MSASNPPPKIACPHCQALIKSPALPDGSQVNCPKCGKAFRLGEKSEVGSRKSGVGEQAAAKAKVQPPQASAARPASTGPAASQPPRKLHNSVDPKVAPLAPGKVVPTRPLAPLPPLADDGFVSLEMPSAATQQQPVKRQRPPLPSEVTAAAMQASVGAAPLPAPSVELVDPNLLPPPPPRKKPKPTQVPVVCWLCGTRLHVPIEKIGQTIQCPDCHTVNEIKPLKVREEGKTPKGPSLENAEEFGLSVTVERPAYRPLQKPRGEYEILSALDPESVPHGWTLPDAPAKAARPDSSVPELDEPPAGPSKPVAAAAPAPARAAAAPAAAAVAAAPAAEYEEDDEEFVVSEPVERIELAPPPIKLPPPDPENTLYDGRYEDELAGTGANRKSKDGWKRAPFMIGVVEFLFQQDALLRWILYAMGAAVLVALANAATPNAGDDNVAKAQNQAVMMVCAFLFGIGFMAWVAPFACCCLAIVEDTANGGNEVTSWPDYNILEWFSKAAYFPAAAMVAGFPGVVLGSFLVSSSGFPPIVVGLVVLVSWVALFPLVLSSMLAESSIFAVYSPQTFRSLRAAADGWMMFYVFTILLGFLGAVALALASVKMIIISSVGATALVVLAFLYCRLLGRMMWLSQEKLAMLPAEGE